MRGKSKKIFRLAKAISKLDTFDVLHLAWRLHRKYGIFIDIYIYDENGKKFSFVHGRGLYSNRPKPPTATEE